MMAPDRLSRFSQRNVLAATNRPMIAPIRVWANGRLVLMVVIAMNPYTLGAPETHYPLQA
jgi:hypothetical protein